MNDPKVRRDGKCACGCGKLRPIVTATGKQRRELIRYAGEAQLEADPFATSLCARRFYGCELDHGIFTDEQIEARAEAGRRGKAASGMSHA